MCFRYRIGVVVIQFTCTNRSKKRATEVKRISENMPHLFIPFRLACCIVLLISFFDFTLRHYVIFHVCAVAHVVENEFIEIDYDGFRLFPSTCSFKLNFPFIAPIAHILCPCIRTYTYTECECIEEQVNMCDFFSSIFMKANNKWMQSKKKRNVRHRDQITIDAIPYSLLVVFTNRKMCTFFCHRNGCLRFLHHSTFGILSLNGEIERERESERNIVKESMFFQQTWKSYVRPKCAMNVWHTFSLLLHPLVSSFSFAPSLLFSCFFSLFLTQIFIPALSLSLTLSLMLPQSPNDKEEKWNRCGKEAKKQLKMYVMSQSNIYLLRPIE